MSGHAWLLTPEKGFDPFAQLVTTHAGLAPSMRITASILDRFLSWMFPRAPSYATWSGFSGVRHILLSTTVSAVTRSAAAVTDNVHGLR